MTKFWNSFLKMHLWKNSERRIDRKVVQTQGTSHLKIQPAKLNRKIRRIRWILFIGLEYSHTHQQQKKKNIVLRDKKMNAVLYKRAKHSVDWSEPFHSNSFFSFSFGSVFVHAFFNAMTSFSSCPPRLLSTEIHTRSMFATKGKSGSSNGHSYI